MAAVAVPALDVRRLALAVQLAARAPGVRLRPGCQLRNQNVVVTLLATLLAGFSRASAARAAGVSEAAVRQWLDQGAKLDDPRHPYVQFRMAVGAIEAAHEAARPKPTPPPAAPVVQVAAAVPTPPPASVPVMPAPAQLQRWQIMIGRAKDLTQDPHRRAEGLILTELVEQEMRELGVDKADVARMQQPPRLNLPPNLSRPEIAQRYTRWCRERGQRATDYDVELHAMAWYREHVAPSS